MLVHMPTRKSSSCVKKIASLEITFTRRHIHNPCFRNRLRENFLRNESYNITGLRDASLLTAIYLKVSLIKKNEPNKILVVCNSRISNWIDSKKIRKKLKNGCIDKYEMWEK